jgi:hypothetical protein
MKLHWAHENLVHRVAPIQGSGSFQHSEDRSRVVDCPFPHCAGSGDHDGFDAGHLLGVPIHEVRTRSPVPGIVAGRQLQQCPIKHDQKIMATDFGGLAIQIRGFLPFLLQCQYVTEKYE